jgi:hypothetical protein
MYDEGTRRYIPAPSSVSLEGTESKALVFRDPKSHMSVDVLRLAPRIAQARVKVGPGFAVWPRDPVAISIAATDAHGDPIVVGKNFAVQVRVNTENVSVEWQAARGGVRALLPPQEGAGPWIVRVTVLDQYDREVGRGHLEVIRERRPAKVSVLTQE